MALKLRNGLGGVRGRLGASDGEEGNRQFDAFNGIFVPTVLTILGVIKYLRLGWVVGAAGLIGAILADNRAVVCFLSVLRVLIAIGLLFLRERS